jgi:ASPM-SPD-2-Hydin domain-containing protein/HYDIN/CFA65/VesB family protein
MADVLTIVNMIPNSSSVESNQDSEPNLAVNPANPLEMAATAFTPSPNAGSANSPIFYSSDGGSTWSLKDLIAGTPVRDQTLRFAATGGILYAGVLWGGGNNIALINFDILRTNDFSGLTTMTQLATRKNDDQPFVQASTVPGGPDAGKDRIYVGSNDHAPANIPATVDLSLDAAAAAPATSTVVIEGRNVVRDGFQTRPAVHPDGTIYAIFYALLADGTCDVVIVRDDNWASGANPFNAIIDPGDNNQGLRIATGVNNPFGGLTLGQQRIGGDLSIAVDPNNSATVYVVWGDQQGGTYTLYVRKSTDSGITWSGNLRTIANATNPALAINSKGRLGFLYQQVTGLTPGQRWETTLELTASDFASTTSYILANTPADTPIRNGQPYLGDYLYMMAVGTSFYGIFSANNTPDKDNFPNGVTYQRNADFATKTLLAGDNVTHVQTSIDPFFFKVAPKTGRIVTAIADTGNFGEVCLGSFTDEELTIDNGGEGPLSITGITSSSPDFLPPSVLSYPIKLGAGDSIEVAIRFKPTSVGAKTATITIVSDDPAGPHHVRVSGVAPTPRLSLLTANSGNLGKVCTGAFADQSLILNNSGHCLVTVSGVASSSPDFLVPQVLSLPLLIDPGDSLSVPVRFAPTSLGAKSATITVTSSDPNSPHTITVSGEAPSGKLAVTGSLCFGGVKACCRAERTISICNIGECALHVASVAFKRKNKHWKLVNNPFPATVAPGSCLSVVVRYKATEKVPIASELVITSDDPTTPVKALDVMAYTIWNECGCKQRCDKCRECGCNSQHDCCCEGQADDCFSDEDDEDER